MRRQMKLLKQKQIVLLKLFVVLLTQGKKHDETCQEKMQLNYG